MRRRVIGRVDRCVERRSTSILWVLHNMKKENSSEIVPQHLKIFLPKAQIRKHVKMHIIRGPIDPEEKKKQTSSIDDSTVLLT